MNQADTIIEMLSEHRAGSKLKRISITHDKDSSLSEVRFIFEDKKDKNTERVIGIYGKDLGVMFGCQKI